MESESVEEKIYPTSLDPEKLMDLVDCMDDKLLNSITKQYTIFKKIIIHFLAHPHLLPDLKMTSLSGWSEHARTFMLIQKLSVNIFCKMLRLKTVKNGFL